MRNTASKTNSETTGTSATRQVSDKLSSGFISCVNMILPSLRGPHLLSVCVAAALFFDLRAVPDDRRPALRRGLAFIT
jgi:hypothetical protein